MWLLAIGAALAQDASGIEGSLHGDTKLFFVASAPPETPATTQGTGDLRLKGSVIVGEYFSFRVHETLTAFPLQTGGLASAGVGLGAPQLIDATVDVRTVPADARVSTTTTTPTTDGATRTTTRSRTDDPQMGLRLRTDRFWVRYHRPSLDVTLGRQPVTFGSGLVFTPMDVVNPFSPATIDTEYKPGVDALRIDAYAGFSSRVTGVVAWAGDPIHQPDRTAVDSGDLIAVVNAQTTVGVTDLIALAGAVRGEGVFGLGVISALGPIGIHGDVTLTLPGADAAEDDPFVRGVVGADWRPTTTTTVSGEGYVQTFGTGDPTEYLTGYLNPRVSRGEVWQVGRFYASIAVMQEITPLVSASVALIGNLEDPSALVVPGLSWSVSNEAALSAGAYLGMGKGPGESLQIGDLEIPVLRSEFGSVPPTIFVQMRAYF